MQADFLIKRISIFGGCGKQKKRPFGRFFWAVCGWCYAGGEVVCFGGCYSCLDGDGGGEEVEAVFDDFEGVDAGGDKGFRGYCLVLAGGWFGCLGIKYGCYGI